MRAARLLEANGDHAQQLAAAEDALAYVAAAFRFPDGHRDGLRLNKVEALLQRASARESLELDNEAVEDLLEALRLLSAIVAEEMQAEAARLSFEVNFRLMRLLKRRNLTNPEVARHAVAAIERAQSQSPNFLRRVVEITDAITGAVPPASAAAALLLRKLLPPSNSATGQFLSRAPSGSPRFIEALSTLLALARPDLSPDETRSMMHSSIELVGNVLMANELRLLGVLRGIPRRPRLATPISLALHQALTFCRCIGDARRRDRQRGSA